MVFSTPIKNISLHTIFGLDFSQELDADGEIRDAL
jgi:hypothetical protein